MMKILKIDYDTNERIFGLDLLRTIAILVVVLGHGDAIVRDNFPNFVNFWIVDGVDLFFVLSGFLIGSIIIKSFEKYGVNRDTIIIFWKRRWFRTLPNYYLIIVLCLIYIFIKTKSFGDFSSWDWTSPATLTGVDKANITFKAFYRSGIMKPIAIMAIYKLGSITRYYCIPTIDATDLWNKTLEQLWNERTDHECMVVLTQGLMKLSSENIMAH